MACIEIPHFSAKRSSQRLGGRLFIKFKYFVVWELPNILKEKKKNSRNALKAK